ncbi:DUF4340 domain-containing protein [Candidatus Parcubacteria bacterium]|nr:DUF4340 domain-containing protein [Candidatus Parcubacteria bacterium]
MNKRTLILGGILIILIALAYFYQGPIKDWRADLGKPDNFLAIVDVEQIDKIEIVRSGKTTILEKHGDKWKIVGTKGFYVKQDLADSLKSGLDEAVEAVVELASSNKDKKSEFQTDLENGVNVKLIYTPDPSQEGNDEVAADFIVGKRGVDFTSTYISEPASDNTYILKANISSLFNRGDWYDKTIFSSDKAKISRIRFQYPTREFTITKTQKYENTETLEQEWEGILPYEFSVDAEKIDTILDIMSDLTAVEIPEQNFAGTGLEKNLIIVQAIGEDIDNTLMIGDAYKTAESLLGDSAEAVDDDGLYYAKRGDGDNIYLITKEQRDELDKRIMGLK